MDEVAQVAAWSPLLRRHAQEVADRKRMLRATKVVQFLDSLVLQVDGDPGWTLAVRQAQCPEHGVADLRKLLKRQEIQPAAIITDGLRSYSAATALL